MDIIYKEESYLKIGICMEVHNNLGKGFSEIVYKDAIEYELCESDILYGREEEFKVSYKGTILPHKFYADFTVNDKIILEVKAVKELTKDHTAQTINYLKVSGMKLGLLVNFGETTLKYKRIVL